MNVPNSEKLIVALDSDSIYKAEKLVIKLSPYIKIFKIGSELFTAAGPDSIKMVHNLGCKVFLDLKFHDIPNTVERAAKIACEHKVFMFNVHSLGGARMMMCAAKVADDFTRRGSIKRPLILAVTVLTSLNSNDIKAVGLRGTVRKNILDLANLAKSSGLDGVVASPSEIVYLKRKFGKDFLVVTPGVRPKGAKNFDQKRVATPGVALKRGADFIVIGRPITASRDPRSAALSILKEMKEDR